MTSGTWPRAVFCFLVCLAAAWGGEASLDQIGKLRGLRRTVNTSIPPVRVRGVVTATGHEMSPDFIMQDGTGGAIVRLPGNAGDSPKPGQEVEVMGEIDGTVPELRILAGELKPLGIIGMPRPADIAEGTLAVEPDDLTYSRLSGVIRKVEVENENGSAGMILEVGPAADPVRVRVARFDEGMRAALQPDAAISASGILRTRRSMKFQSFGVSLDVADPTAIQVIRAASADPAALPLRSLVEVLSSAPDAWGGHRQKIRGIVTLCWSDGRVAVEDADGAMLIELDQSEHLDFGMRVEVAGFPTRRDHRVILENAVVVSRHDGARITPQDMGAKRLLEESYHTDRDGRLLRVAGTIHEIVQGPDRWVLLTETEGIRYHAILPKDQRLPRLLRRGVEAQLDGVCRMLTSDQARRAGQLPDSFELMLPEGYSINVTGEGDWWTPGKLMVVSSVLGVLLVMCMVWSAALWKRTRQRNAMLIREIQARYDAGLLASERARLALDLHDTLSQSLSGAAMQLEIASKIGRESEKMDGHFMLARRLLDRGREDLRRTVWDLNPSMLERRGLMGALEGIAEEINQGGKCEVIITAREPFPEVPERIRVHLFRVAQEAISNAVRHGRASRVEVVVESLDGTLLLRISDNGCGFDPATAPGPDKGHFGLLSLGERIERLGGRLEIRSGGGSTDIIARVPMEERREQESHPSPSAD